VTTTAEAAATIEAEGRFVATVVALIG